MTDVHIELSDSNSHKYTIMPDGNYYNFNALQMMISLSKGTFSKGTTLQITIGWINIYLFNGNKESMTTSFTAQFYIIPFLTDTYSHIIFQYGGNIYQDTSLPVIVDIRRANSPFELKSSHNMQFDANIVCRYV